MSTELPLALRATSAGLRLLSGIAPGVAAKTAGNLFCTPRRHRRPAAEAAILESARPFDIRMGLTRLAGWTWGTGPAVLLAHGWEGRGAQLHSLVEPLVEAGYSVVAWDAPGHGESPGKRSSLVEMADAVWAVARHLGEVHGVIAHSMGCAAAGLAIAEGLPVERAAFVAGPSNMLQYTVQFAELLGLSGPVRERMIALMEAQYHVRLADMDFERFALPERVGLLVVHDTDDKEVDIEQGRLVARSWPGAQLMETSGYGHRRILRAPEVVDRLVGWMAQNALAVQAR